MTVSWVIHLAIMLSPFPHRERGQGDSRPISGAGPAGHAQTPAVLLSRYENLGAQLAVWAPASVKLPMTTPAF